MKRWVCCQGFNPLSFLLMLLLAAPESSLPLFKHERGAAAVAAARAAGGWAVIGNFGRSSSSSKVAPVLGLHPHVLFPLFFPSYLLFFLYHYPSPVCHKYVICFLVDFLFGLTGIYLHVFNESMGETGPGPYSFPLEYHFSIQFYSHASIHYIQYLSPFPPSVLLLHHLTGSRIHNTYMYST